MRDLQLPLLAQTTNTGTVVGPSGTVVGPSSTPEAAAPTATTAAPGAAPVAATQKESGGIFGGFMGILPIILMLGVLYVVLIRGQKKEEKKRKAMISELKKGDRVMTIGGLIARVVSVDGEEVVLKVDESNNVKETYRKSAIQEVLTASGEEKK